MLKTIAALLLLVSPAYAGTNSGNFNDNQAAASAFCRAVIQELGLMSVATSMHHVTLFAATSIELL